MKVGLKKFNLTINLQFKLKIDLTKTDWNTLINLGTLLATLYSALK